MRKMSTLAFRRFWIALALAVVLLAAPGRVQSQPTPAERRCPDLFCELLTGLPRWTVRALEPKDHWHILDSNCVLRLERTALACRENGKLSYEVAFRDILGVVHESEALRPVPALMARLNRDTFVAGWEAAQATGNADHLTAAAMIIAAQTAVLAPVAWVKTTTNYVHLLVRDREGEQVYSYRLTSTDADSFLRALRAVAERDTLRVHFAGGIAQGAARVAMVRFNQIVTIGRRSFFPGQYLLALVEGEEGLGMIYVFSSERAGFQTKVFAAPARVTPAPASAPEGIYSVFTTNSWWRLVELRWAGRSARPWSSADEQAEITAAEEAARRAPASAPDVSADAPVCSGVLKLLDHCNAGETLRWGDAQRRALAPHLYQPPLPMPNPPEAVRAAASPKPEKL